jgi:hypothetical protein
MITQIVDEDEVTQLIASADAALANDPTGWLKTADLIQASENGDTWQQCRRCGIPVGEMCAWCGCDCPPDETPADHPACVGIDYLADHLREYGTAS